MPAMPDKAKLRAIKRLVGIPLTLRLFAGDNYREPAGYEPVVIQRDAWTTGLVDGSPAATFDHVFVFSQPGQVLGWALFEADGELFTADLLDGGPFQATRAGAELTVRAIVNFDLK